MKLTPYTLFLRRNQPKKNEIEEAKEIILNLSVRKLDPETRLAPEEHYTYAKVNGILKEVEIYFPEGTDNLVEVAVGINFGPTRRQLIPDSGYIYGNNQRIIVRPMIPVHADTPIWAEIRNRDKVYPHDVDIYIKIERVTPTNK